MLRIALLLTVPLLLSAGCRKKQMPVPQLQRVDGVVMNDGMPVSSGTLSLSPELDDLPCTIVGAIDDHGRISLTTTSKLDKNPQPQPGVPAGRYHLTYHPENENESNPAIEVETTFTAVVGITNFWTIELVK